MMMIPAQETMAAAFLAVLELDATSVGTMLLSRPFVVGPLLPGTLRSGARCAVIAAPWLGAGGLAASLWSRR